MELLRKAGSYNLGYTLGGDQRFTHSMEETDISLVVNFSPVRLKGI